MAERIASQKASGSRKQGRASMSSRSGMKMSGAASGGRKKRLTKVRRAASTASASRKARAKVKSLKSGSVSTRKSAAKRSARRVSANSRRLSAY